jgi:hypothetical protein
MDQPEVAPQNTPPIGQADLTALVEEVRLLRKYLVIALAATVAVALCFNAFLYRVDRSTRGQIVQTKQVRAELEQRVGITLGAFLKQVVDYAGAHPEAAPLLAKYGIKLPASNAPAVTPVPVNIPKTTAPAATPAGGTKK